MLLNDYSTLQFIPKRKQVFVEQKLTLARYEVYQFLLALTGIYPFLPPPPTSML